MLELQQLVLTYMHAGAALRSFSYLRFQVIKQVFLIKWLGSICGAGCVCVCHCEDKRILIMGMEIEKNKPSLGQKKHFRVE